MLQIPRSDTTTIDAVIDRFATTAARRLSLSLTFIGHSLHSSIFGHPQILIVARLRDRTEHLCSLQRTVQSDVQLPGDELERRHDARQCSGVRGRSVRQRRSRG